MSQVSAEPGDREYSITICNQWIWDSKLEPFVVTDA